MSTDENTSKSTPADDDTTQVDAVVTEAADETAGTTPIDTVDETVLIEPVDQTLVVETVDETVVVEPVDRTLPLDVNAADEGAPARTTTTAYPVVVSEPTPTPRPSLDTAHTGYAPPVGAPYGRPETEARVEPVVVSGPEPEPRRLRLRVGTVVWGLVIAAFGLGVLAWAGGARIDFQLALIILLAVAGSVLLVGSLVSGARSARR